MLINDAGLLRYMFPLTSRLAFGIVLPMPTFPVINFMKILLLVVKFHKLEFLSLNAKLKLPVFIKVALTSDPPRKFVMLVLKFEAVKYCV